MTNPLACPACGYERQPADDGPLSACPSCKVVFAQFQQAKATRTREKEPEPRRVASKTEKAPRQLICTRCGSVTSHPATITKGSFAMEVVLWFLILIPGLIYSTWRLTSRHAGCPTCSSDALIPVDTPTGRELMNRLGGQP